VDQNQGEWHNLCMNIYQAFCILCTKIDLGISGSRFLGSRQEHNYRGNIHMNSTQRITSRELGLVLQNSIY
jgi:hypothetical protein